MSAYAGVVGLKESDLDALGGEESLALGEVERGVVRRGVPILLSVPVLLCLEMCAADQLVKNVILSVDILNYRAKSYDS